MKNMHYDCSKICKCKKPEWNDSLINFETDEMCVHCDVCGGVPKKKEKEST